MSAALTQRFPLGFSAGAEGPAGAGRHNEDAVAPCGGRNIPSLGGRMGLTRYPQLTLL